MFGSTIVKTILWDPFPGLLKVFIAFLLVFLICALFWKLILVLRFKARGGNVNANKSLDKDKNNKTKNGTPLETILRQANDHYQLALGFAEQKNYQQAIVNATKTIAFLQSALEVSTTEAIAKRLNNIPPEEFIQMIQLWIDNDLSKKASASGSSNSQGSSRQSSSSSNSNMSQQVEALKNSALTFAQLRAKGPFPSRRP
jgi:hypothetical protein